MESKNRGTRFIPFLLAICIIAGIFIIFEDEYHVGEIVNIGDFRGTVMDCIIAAYKKNQELGK